MIVPQDIDDGVAEYTPIEKDGYATQIVDEGKPGIIEKVRKPVVLYECVYFLLLYVYVCVCVWIVRMSWDRVHVGFL